MKKIMIVLLVIILQSATAQNFSCKTRGFIPIPKNVNRLANQNQIPPTSNTPLVLNAFFTLFKDENGHTMVDNWENNPLGSNQQIEERFLECVKILNMQYNP
jgi:hypothetical protein